MALIRPIPKADITFSSMQTGGSPLTLEVGKTYILNVLTDRVSSGTNTIITGADFIMQPTKFVDSGTVAQIDMCIIKPTSTSVTVASNVTANLPNIAYIEVE